MPWPGRASSAPWGARVNRGAAAADRTGSGGLRRLRAVAAGCLLAGAFHPGAARSEPRASDRYPRFLADVVSRPDDRGEPGVVALIQICADGLRFERDAGGYLAVLEISLIAYDRRNRQVTGDTWLRHVVVAGYDGTTADTLCLLETPRLSVPAGEYRVAVGLADRRTGERSRLEFPVRAGGEPKAGLRFHDPVYRGISADKGRMSGPLPARRYGEEYLEVVAEVEVTSAGADASFPAGGLSGLYRVEDVNGEEVARGELVPVEARAPADAPDSSAGAAPAAAGGAAASRPPSRVFRLREPLAELTRGVYTLRITWSGPLLDGGKHTQRSQFEVRASRLFWLRDYFATVEALRYIATPDEMRALRDALPEERRARWHQFWKRRDPSPGTRHNEWEEEYLRRVAHANREFGNVRTTGWQSDRGRIYILHGPPDEVQRTVAPTGAASEVWHYFRDGRQFVFVDVSGLGDYRLGSEQG